MKTIKKLWMKANADDENLAIVGFCGIVLVIIIVGFTIVPAAW